MKNMMTVTMRIMDRLQSFFCWFTLFLLVTDNPAQKRGTFDDLLEAPVKANGYAKIFSMLMVKVVFYSKFILNYEFYWKMVTVLPSRRLLIYSLYCLLLGMACLP